MKTIQKNKPTFLALAALTVLAATSLQSINAMNNFTKNNQVNSIDKASIQEQINDGDLSFRDFCKLYTCKKKLRRAAVDYFCLMSYDGFTCQSYQNISDLLEKDPSLSRKFFLLFIDHNNFHLIDPIIIILLISYETFTNPSPESNDKKLLHKIRNLSYRDFCKLYSKQTIEADAILGKKQLKSKL